MIKIREAQEDFCKPKFIGREVKRLVRAFKDRIINLDGLLNGLFWIQPYQQNNVLFIKYLITAYKVIKNKTFIFWKLNLSQFSYNKIFNFCAQISELCEIDVSDVFFYVEPRWP